MQGPALPDLHRRILVNTIAAFSRLIPLRNPHLHLTLTRLHCPQTNPLKVGLKGVGYRRHVAKIYKHGEERQDLGRCEMPSWGDFSAFPHLDKSGTLTCTHRLPATKRYVDRSRLCSFVVQKSFRIKPVRIFAPLAGRVDVIGSSNAYHLIPYTKMQSLFSADTVSTQMSGKSDVLHHVSNRGRSSVEPESFLKQCLHSWKSFDKILIR